MLRQKNIKNIQCSVLLFHRVIVTTYKKTAWLVDTTKGGGQLAWLKTTTQLINYLVNMSLWTRVICNT
jgi:hypothetical protein